jgi:hypothetical protein
MLLYGNTKSRSTLWTYSVSKSQRESFISLLLHYCTLYLSVFDSNVLNPCGFLCVPKIIGQDLLDDIVLLSNKVMLIEENTQIRDVEMFGTFFYLKEKYLFNKPRFVVLCIMI